MGEPLAFVRIRLSDLSQDWLDAFAGLVAAIDEADPMMLTDEVRDAADRARAVLAGNEAG